MARVGVFFSFEFGRDKELYGSFFAQAKDKSRHAIRNYSLDESHPPEDDSWVVKAENKIRQCQVVIVVVGKDTHNAPGVEEEVKIAKRLDKPMFSYPNTARKLWRGRWCGRIDTMEMEKNRR